MKKATVVLAALLTSSLLTGPAIAGDETAKERMRPALIVIDTQNHYLPMMSEEGKDLAIRMINAAIHLFREHNYPVLRVYHTDLTYGPEPGSEAFQFPESIDISEDDPMVVKNYPSAFTKTELEELLRDRDVNTVFLCGLSAVGCVYATYFGAMDRGFDVFMVKNGLLSHRASYTDMVEDVTGAVGYQALSVMLANALK